jgi:hypothetical protein
MVLIFVDELQVVGEVLGRFAEYVYFFLFVIGLGEPRRLVADTWYHIGPDIFENLVVL